MSSSGKGKRDDLVALSKDILQVRRAFDELKILEQNLLAPELLANQRSILRSAVGAFNPSDAIRSAVQASASFKLLRESLDIQLAGTIPKALLAQLELITKISTPNQIELTAAYAATAMASREHISSLSNVIIPNSEYTTANISCVMQDVLGRINSEFATRSDIFKQNIDALQTNTESTNHEKIDIKKALEYIVLLLGLLGVLFDAASLFNELEGSRRDKQFQESLLISQTQILGQLYELNSKISLATKHQHNVDTNITKYVVMRAVNLRTHSSSGKGSQIITILAPNQVVELLKRGDHPNKKWIYVGYFDHVDGIPRTGWVYKKYLKKLPEM